MGRVFINYRRDDTGGYVGRLRADLVKALGKDQVFRDIDGIQLGEDFRQAIQRTLDDTSVMIAAVGRRWLTITNDAGKPRLFEDNDLVRLEIEEALARRIRVIPVLIDGAKMPSPSELPDTIQGFAGLHAHRLDDDRWDHDVGVLQSQLPTATSQPPQLSSWKRYALFWLQPSTWVQLKEMWQWLVAHLLAFAIWLITAAAAAPKYNADDGLSIYIMHGVAAWLIVCPLMWLFLRSDSVGTPWLKFSLLGSVLTALTWTVFAQASGKGAWAAAAICAATPLSLLLFLRFTTVGGALDAFWRALTPIQWAGVVVGWCVLVLLADSDAMAGTIFLDVVVETGVAALLLLTVSGFKSWYLNPSRSWRDLALPVSCVIALWLFWGGVAGKALHRRQGVSDVRVSALGRTARTNEDGIFTLSSYGFGTYRIRLEHPDYAPMNRHAFLVPILRTTLSDTSLDNLGEGTIAQIELPWPISSRAIRGVFGRTY